MKSHCRPRLGRVALAIAGLVSASSLFAQTVAPPTVPPTTSPPPPPVVNRRDNLPMDAGRELEANKPPQSTGIKKDANVLPPDDARRPAGTGSDDATVMVRGFRLTGNTVFSDEVLLPLVRPWVGKAANTDQLLDAAEAVKDRYKDAGYFLTQVLVPAQEVPDGIVTLRVVEARIGQTHAEVTTHRVSPRVVDGYMALLPSGASVTEADVERPLLLLNDLPGLKVNSVLRPGAQTGEADLVVKVADEGRTWGGDAYLDNAGNQATGTVRLGADLVANGLLGQGESWSLGGLISERNGVDLVRAGVPAPVGPYGTKATLSLTSLNYKVIGPGYGTLDADGDALVGSASVQHPLVRSRNLNLFLVGGADAKSVNDRQLGGAKQDRRDLYDVDLGMTGDFRDQYFGGSLNSFTLTLTAGHDHAKDADTTGHAVKSSFQHLNADFQRLQAITQTTSVLLLMRGQYAFQNLDTSEKSSLGGPHGVRGFAVGDGVGDDLFLGTLELRQRVPSWTIFNAPFMLSAFVDGGRVRGWHSPLPTDQNNLDTLGSYGVGLNLTSRDNFQFRLDVAHRINKEKIAGSDNHPTRAWASLQKWF